MNQFAQPQSRQVPHFAGEKGCQSSLQPCANLFGCEFLIHVSPPACALVTRRGLSTQNLGSMTTAFPNVSRSGGRCSSIQAKAAGEIGRSRKMERWFSPMKSDRVGELPEAAKNRVKTSRLLWRSMPSKVELGRRLRWVCSYRPYPFFRRMAPWPCRWLGCRTAKIAVTLDTRKEYRGSNSFDMVRKYCEEMCCDAYTAESRTWRALQEVFEAHQPSACVSVPSR
jgi:hypothetical protein